MIDESSIWEHSVLEFENGMNQGLIERNSASTAVYQSIIFGSFAGPVSLDNSRSKDDFADMKEMINRSEGSFLFVGSLAH